MAARFFFGKRQPHVCTVNGHICGTMVFKTHMGQTFMCGDINANFWSLVNKVSAIKMEVYLASRCVGFYLK